MAKKFWKRPLHEVTRRLALVAMGKEKAELVIRDAKLVNVCTAEIQEHIDVAVAEGRIALVGDAGHCIGPDTEVIDAKGQYIAPGFMDGHMHVESSMVTVSEFSRVTMPHGTTAIFMDPHEICNVFGRDGVRAMIEDADHTPLKVVTTAPSCVPAVPGFEDTGASIDADDIREMLSWDGVLGLGEMMNYPGVIEGSLPVHAELAETLKADQVITGHYAADETGNGLNAYAAAGIRCCHEATDVNGVIERMRLGVYTQIRHGSAWCDLPEIIHAIIDNNIDDRFVCLVTDDTHPENLVRDGHIDNVLRLAIREGLDPIKAIQFVTINTASCFRLDHELGSITPSKCADIVFFDDLRDIRVTRTIIDGEVVAEDGKVVAEIGTPEYPEHFYHSIHVGGPVTESDFAVQAPADKASDTEIGTRVIEIIPARAGTVETVISLPVKDGVVTADIAQDVMKMAVFERHHETGTKGIGFVKGFGIKKGAMAQTYSHDAHNLVVVGTCDSDMALAARTLTDCGGGMCAVADGEVLAVVPLPIAGLLSDQRVEETARLIKKLDDAWKELGCTIVSPYMTTAILSLACIPELRLTNRGLVDCNNYRLVGLFDTDEQI